MKYLLMMVFHSSRGLRRSLYPYGMGTAHSATKAQPVARPHAVDIYRHVRRGHDGNHERCAHAGTH